MNDKIKIIHIVSRFDIGGMENGVVNICNRIDRKKFIPILCCINGTGPMIERLEMDVKVMNLSLPEGKAPFRSFNLAKYFKKEKPDIIHTHGWGGGFFDGIVGGKIAKTPIMINSEHGKLSLKLHQILIQKILSLFCDRILSVSESLKERLVKEIGMVPDNIQVIHNGVDTEIFRGDYDTSEFKKELLDNYDFEYNEDDFIIGSIGSLKEVKNQKMLINAILKINKKKHVNKYKVIFIGNGPDLTILEKFIIDNNLKNQIVFIGERNDVSKLLSIMDVLVSTSISKSEGLSNVILEAMSSGLPVISTKSVGAVELIKDGFNGFLINSDDIFSLSDKIEFLANNKSILEKMSDNARQYVCENYSINKMITNYENIYISLLSKKNK